LGFYASGVLKISGAAGQVVIPTPTPMQQGGGPPLVAGGGGMVVKGQQDQSGEELARQIGTVVETLKDIVNSIQQDASKEAATFGKFSTWCESEGKAHTEGLAQAQREKDSSFVSSKELEATVSTLQHRLNEIDETIGEISDVLEQAETLRQKDKEKYTQDIDLNRASLDQIANAIRMLVSFHDQGNAQFLQTSLKGKLGMKLRGSLKDIEHSSYILGIFKQLKEDLEKTRDELNSGEKEDKEKHDSFVSTKAAARKQLQDEKAEKTNQLTQARIDLLEAQRINKKATERIDNLSKLLKEVQGHCKAKGEQYQVRIQERKDEIEALELAIKFIKSANELSPRQKLVRQNIQNLLEVDDEEVDALAPSDDEVNDEVAEAEAAPDASKPALDDDMQLDAPPALVQIRARSMGESTSRVMSRFRSRNPQGGFDVAGHRGNANDVVSTLIVQLQESQKSDAEKKQYCGAALDEKEKEKAELEEQLEAVSAAIEFKSSENRKMQTEVMQLNAEIEEDKKSLQEAASIRKQEGATYESGSKDRKVAAKILKQSIAVMVEFYDKQDNTGLLQDEEAAIPPEAFDRRSTRKDLRSKQAIERIEMVVEDIKKEEVEAAQSEKEAVAAYEQLQEDTRNEFDKLMEEITIRKSRMAKHIVQLNSDKEEEAQAQADKKAVVKQIKALHSECDKLLANFDKVAASRNFEIGQLRDVIDILAGSNVAVRSGLIQSSASSPINSREESLMEDLV